MSHWRSTTFCIVAGLVIALAGAPRSNAQNLMPNGEFDFDTLGWTVTVSGTNPPWLVIDHDECGADSGAARIENDQAPANVTVDVRACILDIVGGAPYSLDGFLRFASGQTRSGAVTISIGFLDSEFDCLGSFLGGEVSTELQSTNADVWVHRARRELVAPAASKSATIRINLTKVEAGGSLLASFDGIHLVDGNGYLFGDGFESDTTCRWSSVAP